MQDKVQIANILLTRRCNLRCSFCQLVRNNYNIPGYPTIQYLRDHEISSDKWIYIFERILKNNPNCFFIIYGGEPFLYDGLVDIIKFCHEKNVFYTVISNNTDEIQPRIKKVLTSIGSFRGFTSSVDPVALFDGSGDDRQRKSRAGLQRLIEMKEKKLATDIVAEITVDTNTISYLVKTVKTLTDHGIFSSITVVDDKKSDLYDFSNVKDLSLMVKPTNQVRKIFNSLLNDDSLLIHSRELLNDLFDILPSNLKCGIDKNIHNITVDSDGKVRLCLRIRGFETPRFTNYKDMVFPIRDNGEFISDFKSAICQDYNTMCVGCNWTCMLMSSRHSGNIINH